MYILVMILLAANGSMVMQHTYYENELTCFRAAKQFEAHKDSRYSASAFCIVGEK